MFKSHYRFTKYLSSTLERTAILSAALKKISLQPSVKAAIIRQAFSRDIHSSTWIEGNLLSLDQVTALVEGKDIDAEKNQKTEVKNCIKVLRWVMDHPKLSLNSSRLLKLHSQMTKGLLSSDRSGHWRKVQNYVVNAKQQVVFTPPIPKKVPALMRELLTWLLEAKNEHAIIKSAIFHHEFVTIHPFTDGNGRMARALSQWLLIQGGEYEAVYSMGLDDYFAADRQKYYQMIQETRDMDGDYTHWIEYFAEGLLESTNQLAKQLKVIKPDGSPWTPKQQELLGLLKKRRILGSVEIGQVMKINRARVNQLIAPLVAAGMVIKKGSARAVRYQII